MDGNETLTQSHLNYAGVRSGLHWAELTVEVEEGAGPYWKAQCSENELVVQEAEPTVEDLCSVAPLGDVC